MKRSFRALLATLVVLVASGIDARAEIAGTGSLSGRVSADQPFQAAKVYLRDARRRMTYMTYTNGGRYSAINLMPGTYEVTVDKAGFDSGTQQVVIEGGKVATSDFRLRPGATPAEITSVGVENIGAKAEGIEAAYEDVYPPGPGLKHIERTCISCHGRNWIPAHPNSEAGWNAVLDMMMTMRINDTGWKTWTSESTPLIPEGAVTQEQRAEILVYLTRNFGPDKPVRRVRVDAEVPLDEAALSKALWVEYSVEGKSRYFNEGHFDSQGNVWITEATHGAPAILKLDPRKATWVSYPINDSTYYPHGIIVDPVDGQIWWAGRGVYLSRLDPATGKSKDYTVASEGGESKADHVLASHTPVFDSKADIWFSMIASDRIGKWDRKTDSIKLWKTPTPNGRPYGIVVDRDDKVWYSEWLACKIIRFDPVTEKFTEGKVPSTPCSSRRIGREAQGEIWYPNYSAGVIGSIDPATGKIKEHSMGRFAEPYDTWVDPQDNVWTGDGGRGGMLVKFDQKTERFTYYPAVQPSDMPKLAITREGAVWYADRSSGMSGQFPGTIGVLYPDMTKMTTFGAYYGVRDGKAVSSGSPRP